MFNKHTRVLGGMLFLGILISLLSSCTSRSYDPGIVMDAMSFNVVKNELTWDGMSITLAFTNGSTETIAQNELYLSFPYITTNGGTKSSDLKMAFDGNQIVIKPNETVNFSVFVPTEYYADHQKLKYESPEINFQGYINKVKPENHFGMSMSLDQITSEETSDFLTQQQVVGVFRSEGIVPIINADKTINAPEVGGVKPIVYGVNGSDKNLLTVYVYNSLSEREDSFDAFDLTDSNGFFTRGFSAKNIQIIYQGEGTLETIGETNESSDLLEAINDIVFYNLNEGKKIDYLGESEHWEGKITLMTYEHFIENEDGVLEYSGFKRTVPMLHYKLNDIEGVGELNYTYEFGGLGGSSIGVILNSNGDIYAGYSLSTNGNIDLDQTPTFTVEWLDYEETFELKAE